MWLSSPSLTFVVMAQEPLWLFPNVVCMHECVRAPTAPSMSHFKVLSLPASWHLLTPTIIMLIYIVWLHKVIYARIYAMAAKGCLLLLLNVLKRTLHDHQRPFILSSNTGYASWIMVCCVFGLLFFFAICLFSPPPTHTSRLTFTIKPTQERVELPCLLRK